MLKSHSIELNDNLIDYGEDLESMIRDLLNDYWEDPSNPGFIITNDETVLATMVTTSRNGECSGTVVVTKYNLWKPVIETVAVSYVLDDNGRYVRTDIS